MYPTIPIVFTHLPRALGQMSFLLKCASANLKVFLAFYIYSTPFALYINPYYTFCAFLVKSGDLLSLFFLYLPLADFISLFPFIISQLHACVVCIALPAGLAVVPTQGFYFAFFF